LDRIAATNIQLQLGLTSQIVGSFHAYRLHPMRDRQVECEHSLIICDERDNRVVLTLDRELDG